MIIVNTPVPALERRRVAPTLNGDIEEVAVWNLDGFGQSDFFLPPQESFYVPQRKFPWLPVISAAVPVLLILGWLAKSRR